MTEMRRCLGSAKFGIEAHEAPVEDFPNQSLDLAGRVSVEPDISYWAGDRCLFVGDVKYKRIMPVGFPNADLYQLAAYTIATDLASGILVYAAGEAGDAIHDVRHIGKRLIVAPLDLHVPPVELLGQIKTLASRIAPIAQAA